MKNRNLIVILIVAGLLGSDASFGFCGFGNASVPASAPSCSCPANRIIIHHAETACQTLCVSRGQMQQFINQGWQAGCCGAARLAGMLREPLRIFPNPAAGIASAEFESPGFGSSMIRITDSMGRLVLQMQFTALAGLNTVTLPVEKLLPGMYYLWLTSPAGNDVRELILQ